MDPIIHSLIAVGCMAGFYYLGRWSGRNDLSTIIEKLLETLESEGFIATVLDKNGDKELVPISEMVAKSLREYKKAS